MIEVISVLEYMKVLIYEYASIYVRFFFFFVRILLAEIISWLMNNVIQLPLPPILDHMLIIIIQIPYSVKKELVSHSKY